MGWNAVYNALSFGIAGMGSATIFYWLQLPNLTKNYRSALIITGLVTGIATYHYVRIFNSWVDAFVMKLPADETSRLSTNLGIASAVMGALGYPGEIQNELSTRWFWWACAMLPFLYVVFSLVAGLSEATDRQPESAKGLVAQARYLTVFSWLTYPFVYIVKSAGIKGAIAMTYEQIGYSIADVVAKAVFGVLIWAIAAEKSKLEEQGGLIPKQVRLHSRSWRKSEFSSPKWVDPCVANCRRSLSIFGGISLFPIPADRGGCLYEMPFHHISQFSSATWTIERRFAERRF